VVVVERTPKIWGSTFTKLKRLIKKNGEVSGGGGDRKKELRTTKSRMVDLIFLFHHYYFRVHHEADGLSQYGERHPKDYIADLTPR